MPNRAQIVKAARTWINVPHLHLGRTKKGVDCIGMPLMVCQELGIKDKYDVPILGTDYTEYAEQPKDGFIYTEACRRFNHVEPASMQPGDFVVLRYPVACHCGIVASYTSPSYNTITLIHVDTHKVVEHRLDPKWQHRIVGVFSLLGAV